MAQIQKQLPVNPFKQAIIRREMQYGIWSTLSSPIVAELVAESGFDWLLFDTEHCPIELPGILSLLQAVSGCATTPVVRPAWNDPVLIKRILDIGAQTIMVPFVQSAAEAAAAVAAVRYPPRGNRGITTVGRASRFGRVENYPGKAEEGLCLLIQLETAEALGAIEEIAAVDGVDGIYIGPGDLAASMGHAGNPRHVTVQAAIEDAGRYLSDRGLPAGIRTSDRERAKQYADWGYNFISVGVDAFLLRDAADGLAHWFKR